MVPSVALCSCASFTTVRSTGPDWTGATVEVGAGAGAGAAAGGAAVTTACVGAGCVLATTGAGGCAVGCATGAGAAATGCAWGLGELLPLLLEGMVYSEEDVEELLERDDATKPLSDRDVAPFFAKGRKRNSGGDDSDGR